jgi:hypothetical protein
MCSAHIRRQRPPPISQLCRHDPASGARSPRRCSRTEELDSRRLRGLFARGREDHAPHVDLCNQYDRRAQLPDRPNPAHRTRGRPQAQLHRSVERRLSPPPAAPRNGWPRPFRSTASREVTGQGAGREMSLPCRAFPQRFLVCGRDYPNPIGSDTSCHELASTQAWRYQRR